MPRMLDLFCGRGGWTKGFLAMGWECVGYDINPQPDYPARFIQQDILELGPGDLDGDFICCSSPCEQFSVHGMKCFHKNPKYPEIGILLFNHARSICEDSDLPFLMENVRAAQAFVGKSVNHCGPFHLWGNAVPAVMPKSLYELRKGFDLGGTVWAKGGSRADITAHRRQYDPTWNATKSEKRKQATAKIAEIPLELSTYVAQCATTLIEATA